MARRRRDSASEVLILDFENFGGYDSGHKSPYRVLWRGRLKWGERSIFAIARMTPGGERAVKAAGGVGLKTIIHRGQSLSQRSSTAN